MIYDNLFLIDQIGLVFTQVAGKGDVIISVAAGGVSLVVQTGGIFLARAG